MFGLLRIKSIDFSQTILKAALFLLPQSNLLFLYSTCHLNQTAIVTDTDMLSSDAADECSVLPCLQIMLTSKRLLLFRKVILLLAQQALLAAHIVQSLHSSKIRWNPFDRDSVTCSRRFSRCATSLWRWESAV